MLSEFYLAVGWEPYTWFTIFMVASIIDALLTTYSLANGGEEANPLLRKLMQIVEVPVALFVVKGLHAATVFSTLHINILYLPVIVGIFLAVCIWNSGTILIRKYNG